MRTCRVLPLLGGALILLLSALPTVSPAQGAKKQPPTRGTDQVKGGDGVIGETYSLQSGFNFRITSAEFSIERFVAYESVYPKPDEKLLLMHVTIKNANKEDNFFNPESHSFTIVDANDADHPGHTWRRESTRDKGLDLNLKPGQGIDDLTVCIVVPAHVALKKILLNQGRFGTKDEVIRFPMDNPKNKIKPLPEYARDPADKTGLFTLPELPAKVGVVYPLARFDLKLVGVAYSDETYGGNKAEEDKRYLVATVTVKVRVPGDSTLFEFTEGTASVKDSDGERTNALKDNGYLKAKSDEQANPMLKENDEYTCRIFFALSKKSTPKTLTLSETGARSYVFDLSDVK